MDEVAAQKNVASAWECERQRRKQHTNKAVRTSRSPPSVFVSQHRIRFPACNDVTKMSRNP
jgi:hypothetical protein